jgi:hypothetical protein
MRRGRARSHVVPSRPSGSVLVGSRNVPARQIEDLLGKIPLCELLHINITYLAVPFGKFSGKYVNDPRPTGGCSR